MAGDYVDQDVEGVTVLEFLGEAADSFDPTKLTMVASGSADFGLYRVKGRVVAESHCVIVEKRKGDGRRYDRRYFAQLAGCADLGAEKFRGYQPTTTIKLKGRRGRVSPRTCSISSVDDFVQTKIEIRKAILPGDRVAHEPALPEGFDRVLALAFPFEGPHAPRTIVLVGWDSEKKILCIRTLHEYVEGDKIVPLVTSTLVDLRALVAHEDRRL